MPGIARVRAVLLAVEGEGMEAEMIMLFFLVGIVVGVAGAILLAGVVHEP